MQIKISERVTVSGNQHKQGVLWDLLENPCLGSAWGQGAVFPLSQLIPFFSTIQKLLVRSFKMTRIIFKRCSFSLSLHLAFNERSFLTCRPLMLQGTAKQGGVSLANTTKRAMHTKPPGRVRSAWLPFLGLLRAISRYAGNDNDIPRAAKKSPGTAGKNAQTSQCP